MNDLTGFQRDVLIILSKEHATYFQLKDELENYYATNIQTDRMHSNLNSLIDLGFLTKEINRSDTNQETVYSLTEKGLEKVNKHIKFRNKFVDLSE